MSGGGMGRCCYMARIKLKTHRSLKRKIKVKTSRRETDQGSTLPPAHISELLRGAGAHRLAGEPQGGFGSTGSR